jgi:hypothetical protein
MIVGSCIVLLWAAIAYPWLSGAVTIPYDAKAHFQAQIQFLANAIHRGESPFWTPNIFGGSPQIADPQSLIFSPAIVLALLDRAPSFRAMDAYVFALLLAGGLAMASFGRERGWHPAAQIVAALVLAFGASAAWRIQHVGQIQSLAFFAVAFWLLSRALAHASWRWGLAAGATAGVMVVTRDQVAFLGAYVLAAYVVWFMLREGSPRLALRRSLPALMSASVVGLLIVAAPLAMTLLFSEVSNRAEIDVAEAARGSLHPASLLTAFIGDLFGARSPAVDYWGPSSSAWSPGQLTLSQNMGQVYVGALPVLAVIYLLARGWSRMAPEARFCAGALGAMLVYALGAFTPLFPLVFEAMPGADLFRRPADATFLIGALMAPLAGFAVDDAIRNGREGHRRGLIAAGVAASVALASGLAAAILHGRLAVSSSALLAGAGWLGLSLVILGLMATERARRLALQPRVGLLAAACLGGLLAVDLRLSNGPNESTALPPERYAVMLPNTDNDTIAYLKALLARGQGDPARRDRVELLGMDFHWPNLGMIHGFDHAFGYNPLHLAEFTEATGARDHMGEAKDRRFTPMFPSFRSAFADMLGLRYVVSPVPLERVDRSLRPGDMRLLARTRDGFIYENPQALPRAMFVERVQIGDFETFLEKGLPAGFDPRATVLLEDAPEIPLANSAATPASSRAKVQLTSYGNTDIQIVVETDRAGILVLHDVWHPWWSATVNGRETDILKANVLFRAVAVPAGRSTVRFRFRPLDGVLAELRERFWGADEPELPKALARVR